MSAECAVSESVVIHRHPDEVESVKIEQNSRGFNITVKAASPQRAIELYDDMKRKLMERQMGV